MFINVASGMALTVAGDNQSLTMTSPSPRTNRNTWTFGGAAVRPSFNDDLNLNVRGNSYPAGTQVIVYKCANPQAGMSNRTSANPYVIAKRAVWEAYQRVKANRGAAGVDEETIAMFEQSLSKNLYKLWNRMSSGSYFPPPVKQVEIPKAKGGPRKLGIPTVSDRIGQTVVKQIIEPKLDPMFHADSYGYRPGRSAKQAIAVTRKRCWQFNWAVEFDSKGALDQIDLSTTESQKNILM